MSPLVVMVMLAQAAPDGALPAAELAQAPSAQRSTASKVMLYGAGAVSVVTGIGHFFVTPPALRRHFAEEPDRYWRDRVTVNAIASGVNVLGTGLFTLLGAYLHGSEDAGTHAAGRWILLLSLVPRVISMVALPILTPEDGAHVVPHAVAAGLIGGGLAFDW